MQNETPMVLCKRSTNHIWIMDIPQYNWWLVSREKFCMGSATGIAKEESIEG